MFSKILPLCLSHFEAYLDGRREGNRRHRSSFRISKLHINHLRTIPFRPACKGIRITFTLDNEYTARQRDRKGRHIDQHGISIDRDGLTRVEILRNLHRINAPALRTALRPDHLLNKDQNHENHEARQKYGDDDYDRQAWDAYGQIHDRLLFLAHIYLSGLIFSFSPGWFYLRWWSRLTQCA
jgi:hypothetical protein